MWVRAVWTEPNGEDEGVIPEVWVKDNMVHWPPGANVTKAAKEMRTPTSSWKMFPLLKIKFKSSELTSIFKSEIVFSTNQINEGINSLFVFYLLQIIRKCVKPSTKQVLQSSVRKNMVLSRGYQRKKYTQGLF